ncbi:ubiquitin-conjugating enzyme E2-binding protein [Pseudoneurospora amorphoporcata]|uniref:Ubiquitin-conjugating enzyme E2-binding protein n=1 Tax=Pseudoneurospora amorphoporcata TaxID=241081 RepID=A0AAN6NTX9_9PEZI|nr:ubiquitin-conjugating enzyme E2-binding protein [Pseudoneurospora amorphoporcata]
MTSQPAPLLYAEFLSHIRQISLAISLGSASDASTRVVVAADGENVELNHHGQSHTLRLPSKVALSGASLPIQRPGASTLSWRLPLGQAKNADASSADSSTWTATDLKAGSQVACRQCHGVVVNQGVVKVWKDLPSENWAEMMEFWHCHKPDDHDHDHDDYHHHDKANGVATTGQNAKADDTSLAARGYGASSLISAQQSVGFVDLTTLLFVERDCSNIIYSLSTPEHGSSDRQTVASDESSSQIRSLNVFCPSCQAQLGFYNFRTAAVTLLKWQISCNSFSNLSPGLEECLAATLISTIARSGSSKSLLLPITETIATTEEDGVGKDKVVHIWVLNSGIVYASSATEAAATRPGAGRGISAIKLLYRLVSREEADRMLDSLTGDAQEVNIPVKAIKEVLQHLDRSNCLLPTAERVFKEWKVGLLRR